MKRIQVRGLRILRQVALREQALEVSAAAKVFPFAGKHHGADAGVTPEFAEHPDSGAIDVRRHRIPERRIGYRKHEHPPLPLDEEARPGFSGLAHAWRCSIPAKRRFFSLA